MNPTNKNLTFLQKQKTKINKCGIDGLNILLHWETRWRNSNQKWNWLVTFQNYPTFGLTIDILLSRIIEIWGHTSESGQMRWKGATLPSNWEAKLKTTFNLNKILFTRLQLPIKLFEIKLI